jgi:hypothetical protein
MPIEHGKKRRFYTPAELALHNCAEDCWVSINGNVIDLTAFIAKNRGPLAQPLIAVAGEDISHWFDAKTGNVKTHVDPETDLELPFLPFGRFLHVPPPTPVSNWSTNFGTPWWRDPALKIGRLSERTRSVQVVNILTQQETMLLVCSEEALEEIQDRYLEHNAHARSYTWKSLQEGEFVPLDMKLTLTENGVPDESDEFEQLTIDQDYYTPVLHVYFNDDLTVA